MPLRKCFKNIIKNYERNYNVTLEDIYVRPKKAVKEEERNLKKKKRKIKRRMADPNLKTSIITVKVNGLNETIEK